MSGWGQLSAAELVSWLGLWWWPFVRLSAAFWMMPLLGDYRVTLQLRLLLAFLLSLLVAPMLGRAPVVDPFSLPALVMTVEQILFGLLFGFCAQTLFWLLGMAGHLLSQQMGLAMAVMNDPVHGENEPIVGEFLSILCSLLFLGLNGHLVVLELLVRSLRQWPPGSSLLTLDLSIVWQLIHWSFAGAMTLAFPAMIAMLLVNLTFGVMNRSAPSFNIFSLGFPMSMLVGLYALLLTLSGISGRYLDLVEYLLGQLSHLGVA